MVYGLYPSGGDPMQTEPRTDAPHDADNFIAGIKRGLLDVLPQRPGETTARRANYERILAFCITAFQPRDLPELTAANHCLRFHHVLDDCIDDMLTEADKLSRRKLRPQAYTAGRISLSHGREFQRLRRRPPAEISAPLSSTVAAAASGATVHAAPRAAKAPSAATAPAGDAGGAFAPAQSDVIAAARQARNSAVETMLSDAAIADAAGTMVNILRGNFPAAVASGTASTDGGLASDAGTAAKSFRSGFLSSPPLPRAPANKPAPDPDSQPQPMNRQQRRLAERNAKKADRRAGTSAANASRAGGAVRSA
jgi:hypothetical protein